jgi:hypothetical protein
VRCRHFALITTNGFAHSKARNKIESPLLALLDEIRNIVYEYALGGMEVEPSNKHSCLLISSPREPKRSFHSLLRVQEVCQQMKDETASLPYKLNTFVSPTRLWLKGGLFPALKDAQRHAIREIGLPVNHDITSSAHFRLANTDSMVVDDLQTQAVVDLPGVRSVVMYSNWGLLHHNRSRVHTSTICPYDALYILSSCSAANAHASLPCTCTLLHPSSAIRDIVNVEHWPFCAR